MDELNKSHVAAKIQVRRGKVVQIAAYDDRRHKHPEGKHQKHPATAPAANLTPRPNNSALPTATPGIPKPTVHKTPAPVQRGFFDDVAPVSKKADPRAAVIHEARFPEGEHHLAALERHRHALNRSDAPDPAERKILEERYLKTWQPMIQGIARQAVRDLGIEPMVNDRGKPTGIFADFSQEANIVAMATLRHHDPETHKTHVRDLTKGNIKRTLFERWRSILGVHGSVQDNADLTKLAKVTGRLRGDLGREPDNQELGAAMNLESSRVAELKEMAYKTVMEYLDKKTSDDADAPTLGDTLASPETPHGAQEAAEYHQALKGALSTALDDVKDPRAKLAIALENGMKSEAERYAREVGAKYHVDPTTLLDYSGEATHGGMVRNQLAKRLGMERSAGGKMVTAAYKAMREHPAIKAFHETYLQKAMDLAAIFHNLDTGLEAFVRRVFGLYGVELNKAIGGEVETVTIPATFETVQPWGVTDAGEIAPIWSAVPVVSLLELYTRDLLNRPDLAMETRDRALVDLVGVKEPYVEAAIRDLLARDPGAQVAAVSHTVEGLTMLGRVMDRVLIPGADTWESRSHYVQALHLLMKEREQADRLHEGHVLELASVAKQLNTLQEMNPAKTEGTKLPELAAALEGQIQYRMGLGADAHARMLERMIGAVPFTTATMGDHQGEVTTPDEAQFGVNEGAWAYVIDLDGDLLPAPGVKVFRFRVEPPVGLRERGTRLQTPDR